MRTFTKKFIRDFWEKNASSKQPLVEWWDITEAADWKNFGDLRGDFPKADLVGRNVIFDIGGNNYRLIARVNFAHFGVKIKWIGTHAEYDSLTKEQIRNL